VKRELLTVPKLSQNPSCGKTRVSREQRIPPRFQQ
jgi:hypothetical protein